MSHVLPLGGTGWSVWRDVVPRTADSSATAGRIAADALLREAVTCYRHPATTG
ncbi:hypothetical protein [Micromonospora sp. DT231]|uniref:hypothetical protein n=1 Tax=Micromonospora sp. DT231 TaxID=3416526 RepID=UPI003CEE25FD